MAAIDPGIQRRDPVAELLRRATRLAAVGFYFTALIVAIALVRPAFRDVPTPVRPATRPALAQTDVLRRGETVATFASRHGLELGDLLALNPDIDSLSLPAGTKLRIG